MKKDEHNEKDNIIQHAEGVVIMNGGSPLPGCPEDWNEAEKIEAKLNEGKDIFGEPKWKFDCGFKLDFDGSLIRVCSRFYPPKSQYGPTWDGTVDVIFLGDTIATKDFNCQTLEELKTQVEDYVKRVAEKLRISII